MPRTHLMILIKVDKKNDRLHASYIRPTIPPIGFLSMPRAARLKRSYMKKNIHNSQILDREGYPAVL